MKRLVLILALCGCPAPKPPAPPPGAATCADWCHHAAELGCEAGASTSAGVTCEAVCLNVQTSGFAAFDLECRVHAASCDAAESCERH